MTDLNELLEQDGRRWRAGFQPPDLDAMLAGTTRSRTRRARWAWPIIAAVLLLTVPLITVLVRSNARHAQPAVPSQPGLTLLGSVPWVAAVGQGDGSSVSVYVDVDETPGWCLDAGLPVLRASTVEAGSRIVIRVQAYQPAGFSPPAVPPGSVLGCSAIGHLPVPLLVRLRSPTGHRGVIDATTGKSYPLEPAADLPSLSMLPAGYVDAGSGPVHVPAPGSPTGPVHTPATEGPTRRSYRNGSDFVFLIRDASEASLPYAVRQVQGTGVVLGHPAKVGGLPGGDTYRCVVWSGDGYSWEVCSTGMQNGQPWAPLSAAELLRIANSMR
jgi:hypothetical protein